MLQHIRHMFVWYAFGLALVALFQPAFGFAASLPVTRDVVVFPGTEHDVDIPLTNAESTAADVSLLLFSATFESGIEEPRLESLPTDIAAWVAVSSSAVTVLPGTTTAVTLSLHPPKETQPQTFVLAIVAAEKQNGDIALVHGSATLVFVSVGDISPQGSCESFTQESPGVSQIALSNTGRGILYDDGEIVLRGIFGLRFGAVSSNPLFHRVLSGQTRTWNADLPPIPWWAFGPLSYSLSDAQIRERPCVDIRIGGRWLPLFGAGMLALGATAWFIRRRIS